LVTLWLGEVVELCVEIALVAVLAIWVHVRHGCAR
jgi:hypothetical protein